MRLIRSIAAATLTAALVAGAFGANSVSAQGQNQTAAPGAWASAINIQNASDAEATMSITFYDAAGNVAPNGTFTPSKLAGRASVSLYVPAAVATLGSGQYSAVVSSDQPVKVSVNTGSTASATAPWTAMAYEGIDSAQTGTTLYFPAQMNNYFNFFSEMVIQNASASSATLTARFFSEAGVEVATANLGTLPANASQTYVVKDLQTSAPLPSGPNGLFGVVVTSSVNVAGVGNVWRTTPANGAASYNAATGGATTLYVPNLLNNYFGFASALSLQNVSATPATFSITYSNGTVVNDTLAPLASKSYFQPLNPALPTGNTNGIYSAQVVATAGSLVGIVGQSIPEGGNGAYTYYNVPSFASDTVDIPVVLQNYFGLFTAVTVQNVGTQPTDVTLTFSDASIPAQTKTGLAPNATHAFLQLGSVAQFQKASSAIAKSSNGQKLVAVYQQNTEPSVAGYEAQKAIGDYLSSVTGVGR